MGQPDVRKNSCKQEKHSTALHARGGGGGSGGAGGRFSWFDIRVFYVRVMRCFVSDSPEILAMCFPFRSIEVVLEINGGRIAPPEQAWVALRRDRVDSDTEEVTYVSTDNLRIAGGALAFEIYDKHEFLIMGSLKAQPFLGDGGAVAGALESLPRSWKMECSSESGSSLFIRTRSRHSSSKLLGSCMEVYIVGRYIDTPVILTQTVHLANHRRSQSRYTLLDVIPEDEECQIEQYAAAAVAPASPDAQDDPHQTMVSAAGEEYSGVCMDASMLVVSKLYNERVGTQDDDDDERRRESEDGEIVSWFNAGVRVGVGIGLGMCLGVGIGVGLLVRTYNATAKSLRRGGLL